jgi:hypothetical protein
MNTRHGLDEEKNVAKEILKKNYSDFILCIEVQIIYYSEHFCIATLYQQLEHTTITFFYNKLWRNEPLRPLVIIIIITRGPVCTLHILKLFILVQKYEKIIK